MVYTVTFNPAIDYIARVENLVLGETNRTYAETIHPGGKGINVSIVLKRLGVESVALGFTGGFTGAAIEDMLEQTGIKTEFIRCDGNTRINVKLKERTETEINGKGVVVGAAEMSEFMTKLEELQDGDILVLAGSIPAGMSVDLYADIMRSLSGKDIRTVVDATGELLKRTLPFKPFLIKPNVQELGEIFGTKIQTEKDIIAYAVKLTELGARNVIVSMGGKGAIMVGEDGKIRKCLPPSGKVVDSVGAGDSLVAGFIAGHIESGDFDEAFRTGVATGSATAFSVWLAEKELVSELKKLINLDIGGSV